MISFTAFLLCELETHSYWFVMLNWPKSVVFYAKTFFQLYNMPRIRVVLFRQQPNLNQHLQHGLLRVVVKTRLHCTYVHKHFLDVSWNFCIWLVTVHLSSSITVHCRLLDRLLIFTCVWGLFNSKEIHKSGDVTPCRKGHGSCFCFNSRTAPVNVMLG